MTLAAVPAETDQLSAEELRSLVAHLVVKLDAADTAHRRRMTELIDDNAPANWATLEELDQRLHIAQE